MAVIPTKLVLYSFVRISSCGSDSRGRGVGGTGTPHHPVLTSSSPWKKPYSCKDHGPELSALNVFAELELSIINRTVFSDSLGTLCLHLCHLVVRPSLCIFSSASGGKLSQLVKIRG